MELMNVIASKFHAPPPGREGKDFKSLYCYSLDEVFCCPMATGR